MTKSKKQLQRYLDFLKKRETAELEMATLAFSAHEYVAEHHHHCEIIVLRELIQQIQQEISQLNTNKE